MIIDCQVCFLTEPLRSNSCPIITVMRTTLSSFQCYRKSVFSSNISSLRDNWKTKPDFLSFLPPYEIWEIWEICKGADPQSSMCEVSQVTRAWYSESETKLNRSFCSVFNFDADYVAKIKQLNCYRCNSSFKLVSCPNFRTFANFADSGFLLSSTHAKSLSPKFAKFSSPAKYRFYFEPQNHD